MNRLVLRLKPRRKLSLPQIERIISKEWLSTPEHKRWAYDVMRAGDGRCRLCGRDRDDRHIDGSRVILNADHIISRKARPDLALDPDNGQVLCHFENEGKGNRHHDDWRKPRRSIMAHLVRWLAR